MFNNQTNCNLILVLGHEFIPKIDLDYCLHGRITKTLHLKTLPCRVF